MIHHDTKTKPEDFKHKRHDTKLHRPGPYFASTLKANCHGGLAGEWVGRASSVNSTNGNLKKSYMGSITSSEVSRVLEFLSTSAAFVVENPSLTRHCCCGRFEASSTVSDEKEVSKHFLTQARLWVCPATPWTRILSWCSRLAGQSQQQQQQQQQHVDCLQS